MKTMKMKFLSVLLLAVAALASGTGCTLTDFLFGKITETCFVNNVEVDCSTLAQ